MKTANVFETAFGKIYGKPCWGVWKGVGSFLTLNFGQPRLEIREPVVASNEASRKVRESLARRNAIVKGDWVLWIYCCTWEVLSNGRQVAHSESSNRQIVRAANFLDGQKLIRFSLVRRGLHCIFEFDLGGELRTRPYNRTNEQWLLYEPTGKVLVLRADKRYSYTPSNRPDDAKDWKPIQS